MKAEVKLQLRLPVELRDALSIDATNNHRSMNGQIIAILNERFKAIGIPTDPKVKPKNGPRRWPDAALHFLRFAPRRSAAQWTRGAKEMEVCSTQGAMTALVKTDTIEWKLRGAASMLSMLYGDGRAAFRALGGDYQDGFLDTLVDLTEDARRANWLPG